MTRIRLSVAAFLLIATVGLGQTPGRTLIRAGHLLDVHTGKIRDAQTIVVTGDKITAIAPTASTPAAASDTVIDLGSLTVLPGLIDVHTHLTMNTDFDPYHEVTSTDAKEAINGVVNAKATLMAGFTSVRNVGAGGYTDVDFDFVGVEAVGVDGGVGGGGGRGGGGRDGGDFVAGDDDGLGVEDLAGVDVEEVAGAD